MVRTLRLLIIEDSEDDALLVLEELRNGGYAPDLTRVDTPQALEAALEDDGWDAIISDYNLPSFTGLDALRLVQIKKIDIPFIMVTGAIGEEQAVEAMKAGCHDFIVKGNYSRLALALERELRETAVRRERKEAIVELHRAHAELEQRVAVRTAELRAEMKVRRQAEEALRQAHDELELRISERTQELTRANEKLLQEVAERRRAEESLQDAFKEINRLKTRLQAENIYLRQEVAQSYNFDEIIGQSKALAHVFQRVEQVAPMNATVLLLGETGTGKGVVARAIHSTSARKERPMITVNCASLPANLMESELFGRERGAFTGSNARQIGRFELANHGTIFLDEIGEMPLELQPKLLRVIQDGEFERLGNPRTIKVDVRIIAASNRNLEEEIKGGRFREDLFYRLNVFPIALPPLRQREGDILLLINHFVTKFNKKIGKKIESIAPETLRVLQEYNWPGNVRELESVIERAVIISKGAVLQVLDQFVNSMQTGEWVGQDVKALVELEREHILEVLQKTNWRIEGGKGAAKLLDINPSTLRSRIKKYGILRQ